MERIGFNRLGQILSIRVVVVALVFATLVSCKSTGFVDPPPEETLTVSIVSPSSSNIQQNGWPDSQVELQAEARSSVGGRITSPSLITWKKAGAVIGSGQLVSVSFENGNHEVCVVVKSAINQGSEKEVCLSFVVTPAPPITVELVTSAKLGVINCQNFRAYAQRGSVADSADFNVNCRAEVSPRLTLLQDTNRVNVWFDAKNTSNRSHYPSMASVAKDSLKVNQKFVAGPLEYRIHSGKWSDQTIGIDLETAFAISADGIFSFYRSSTVGSNSVYYSIGGRLPNGFPIQITVRKESGQGALTPTDTVGFGNAVTELSEELGMPMTMVSLSASEVSGWNGILAIVSDTIPIPVGNTQWGASGDIIGGRIIVSPNTIPHAFKHTVKHELVHALGVGHVSLWPPGLMSTDQSSINVGSPNYAVPQPLETGHLWFMYDIWEAKRQSGAQYGIPNMHQAWRVLVLNLPYQHIR